MATTLITSHATLKTVVADWLNRSDLTDAIGNFIANAEERLRLDSRVRSLVSSTFSITGDDLSHPASLDTIDSWYHDGSSYYGAIQIVGAGQLGGLRANYGLTGVPQWAAIIDGKFRFAPVPDATYPTKLVFWETLPALSAGSNWLVASYPSIYLYATLVESAPYLKDDPRVAVWGGILEDLIEKMHKHTDEVQFGDNLQRSSSRVIG
tara:strand:- start:243 stop:866 length:624 start_codon:yes stop_codon:yes gene_type:complete